MVQERATSVQAPHRPRLLERDEQLEVLDSLLAAASPLMNARLPLPPAAAASAP